LFLNQKKIAVEQIVVVNKLKGWKVGRLKVGRLKVERLKVGRLKVGRF